MTALHEANYNITTAEDKLSNIILNQARRIANCYDMLKYFHFSIIKSNKNMRIVAEELNTCPESCLLFYYERYKQTNEYQLFKMYRRAEKDECEVRRLASMIDIMIVCSQCQYHYRNAENLGNYFVAMVVIDHII